MTRRRRVACDGRISTIMRGAAKDPKFTLHERPFRSPDVFMTFPVISRYSVGAVGAHSHGDDGY